MEKKKIKKWNDGDSGIFTDGHYFRLANVRAPEKHQYGGTTALKVASNMTGRHQNVVGVQQIGIDSYGRDIVELKNQDGSINQRMRTKGYTNKGR